MTTPSRVLPSGGGGVLDQWRAQHGPEARRMQVLQARGGAWGQAPGAGLRHVLLGNGSRALRAYAAAANDRLVADLASLVDLSGNAEVRGSLRAMRRRSRQLSNDNEYVRHFLRLLRNHVPGPRGFNLQSKIYKARRRNGVAEPDTDANAEVEAWYANFSKPGNFDVSAKLSRGAFERAAITALARDGELVIEQVVGPGRGLFGMQWRLIDPDLIDDTLNIGINGSHAGYGRLDTNHQVRMGVETDGYGKAVAYWMLTAHPGDDMPGWAVMRHRRVPADRIIHWYLAEELRPDTARGVPWIFSAVRRMAMLGGYEEAALVAARQGASKMGFYQTPAAEKLPFNTQPDGSSMADGEDAEGNLITEAEPGTFGVLPAGWDFKTYDPAYPHDQMQPFVKGMLRAFASGVGLDYNTLASDNENVNLSTMRHAANGNRITYEALQQAFIEHVGVPMFERSLQFALDMGAVGRMPSDAFDRLNKPLLIGPHWRSPDPQKDIAAAAQQVALATTSRQRICAEQGVEWEEVLDELAQEEAMAKAKGVTLNTAAAAAHKTPAVDDAGKPPKKPGAPADPDAEGNDENEDNDDDAT